MAIDKICRICLHTDIPLQEMEEEYSDYFLEICSCKTKHTMNLLCAPCLGNLLENLKFRNKCVQANTILQEWNETKPQEKQPLNSLHTLLITANSIRQAYKHKHEEDSIKVKYEKIDIKTEDSINYFDGRDVVFEEKQCNEHFVDCNELKDENEKKNCVKTKNVLNTTNSGKKRAHVHGKKRVYINPRNDNKGPDRPPKVCREYDQYTEIFDIILFNTIEDARTELLSRVASQPYLTAQFRCDLCYTTFKSDKLMLIHMKCHDESLPLECPVCSFRFLTRKSLRNHRTKCHRGKFSCKMCPLVTYHDSVMKRHFEKHQGKTFVCDCGRVFKHRSTYLNHRRNVHESAHVCVTCARTFVSALGLLNHRARAHPAMSEEAYSEGVKCAKCDLTFPNRHIYNIHVLNTHRDSQEAIQMIACRLCGLIFDDVEKLKQHKKRHLVGTDENGAVKCEMCGAEGAGGSWRTEHYKAHHPHVKCHTNEAASQHMCDQCGKLFSSVYALRDHLNMHLGLRPWACRACAAAFSSYSARAQHELRQGCLHKRRHIGGRTQTCSECGLAFRVRSQLREHIRAKHK